MINEAKKLKAFLAAQTKQLNQQTAEMNALSRKIEQTLKNK